MNTGNYGVQSKPVDKIAGEQGSWEAGGAGENADLNAPLQTFAFETAGLDLPHVGEADKLGCILSAALGNRFSNSLSPGRSNTLYWNADSFGLHQVKVFQDSSLEEQTAILQIANRGLLEEAYFVEKAGMGYMAKMALLAETTEERMLYSLFAANEATHLSQISAFLPDRPVGTDDTFLRFLADLVESQDKAVLLFTIQLVLEGWGLSHYRSLAQSCCDRTLSQVLTGFLQDEARHHGTGLILFEQTSVSLQSRATIVETLFYFLQMIRVGPQRVVGAIAQVKGDLTRSQKIRILEELDTETHSGTRLHLLRSLMRGEAAEAIVQELSARGAFEPLPATQCV
ncbi:MAG TPA: ferritin-like domain-containing protein [Stenomitos sp.]